MPARRSQVTSRSSARVSDFDSPQWKSGKDVIFKTPNSPSPVRRVTRRTSIYQRKQTKTDISKFRVPGASLVSPPGVKTRARRSSIYQKGGSRLLSPETMNRARRASMYVSSRSKPAVNEFSKVFHTPMKVKSPVKETVALRKASPVKQTHSKGKTPTKNRKRSTSPKKLPTPFKSPPIPTLRKRKVSEVLKSPTVEKANDSGQANQALNNIRSKTPARKQNTPKKSDSKTPIKTKPVSPVPSTGKNVGSQSAKKQKVSGTSSRSVKASAASMNMVTSTPANSLDKSIASQSFYGTPGETPVLHNLSGTPKSSKPKSTRKTSKSPAICKTPAVKKSHTFDSPLSAVSAKKSSNKSGTTKSSQKKSTGKTPKSPAMPKTPAIKKSHTFDSSSSAISAKKSSKKSDTPKSSLPKSTKMTPKSAVLRKTPAVKRSHTFDSPLSGAKKSTSRDKTLRSTKKVSKRLHSPRSEAKRTCTEVTIQLTPVDDKPASKDLHNHTAAENVNGVDHDSPKPRKLAKLADAAVLSSTPVKSASVSPKKLAELANENNSSVLDQEESMLSQANETFSSDSRSGRCTIL